MKKPKPYAIQWCKYSLDCPKFNPQIKKVIELSEYERLMKEKEEQHFDIENSLKDRLFKQKEKHERIVKRIEALVYECISETYDFSLKKFKRKFKEITGKACKELKGK